MIHKAFSLSEQSEEECSSERWTEELLECLLDLWEREIWLIVAKKEKKNKKKKQVTFFPHQWQMKG